MGEVDKLLPDPVNGGLAHALGEIQLWIAPLGE